MNCTPPLLELRDVHRLFRVSRGLMRGHGEVHAVNGVSLSLRRGEVLGVVGESGCGKSTLARILLGLLPPSHGDILLDGVPVGRIERKAFARRVQPVFQDPYSSLNPRKTVAAIVSLPLAVHGIGTAAERRRQVAAMLDLVGLPVRVLESYPGQLSGGQRQRVAIARALVMRPEIIVCDEPTSALDVSVQAQILNLLMDLRRELGLTYLFISHNLAVVEHLASRVAVMYLGRVVEEAPPQVIFRQPRHPYTQALQAAVLTPEPGLGIPDPHLGPTFPNPLDPPAGCSLHPRCPAALDRCRSEPPRLGTDGLGSVACHLYDVGNSRQDDEAVTP